jgi:hypothetical protein
VVTPGFEWFPAIPATLEGGGYQGSEGIETYYREIRDTWTELRVAVDEFRDLSDQVLALGRLEGRGIGSRRSGRYPTGDLRRVSGLEGVVL